jgi:hypothetical protein
MPFPFSTTIDVCDGFGTDGCLTLPPSATVFASDVSCTHGVTKSWTALSMLAGSVVRSE